MQRLKLWMGLALTSLLVACGGGGGSPGTVAGGGGTGTGTATLSATIVAGMLNAAGQATNSVPQTGVTATATIKDAAGTAVPGKLVTFSADTTLLRFSPAATALTDANGVASLFVTPASQTAVGAGSLNVSAVVGSATLAGTFDFQVPSAGSVTATGTPSLVIELKDLAGLTTNAVSGAGSSANAILKDSVGLPIVGRLVTFTGDAALIKFSPASGKVLTGANGVATVQVTPASITAGGAGTLNATAIVSAASLQANFDYQLSASNVTLSVLDVGTGSIAAFANRPVSVVANVNGTPATNTPIQVTFQASCGTISPATVTTDNAGKAATTYSASSISCAGSNVSITASAPGAPVVQGIVAVQGPLATNLEFVSAAPSLIYLKDSVGATQSQLLFRVIDSQGTPLQNQSVQVSLVTASQTGVSIGTVGNATPVTLTTNALGQISIAVFSGTVPTSAQVRAVLSSNAAVAATSNVLTVASGRAVQKASSLAASRLSIEGFTVDGQTSDMTFAVSDRQGNPVPDGTQVNFTAESGVMLPATCVITGGNSACTVQIRAQGARPANGRIAILAYVPGEEDFVDANFNNVFDTGETFTDLGSAYRDDNENSGFDTGEFSVPRVGTSVCGGGVNGRPNTCDGTWGVAEVRTQANIIFATSFASTTGTITNTRVVGTTATVGELSVTIADGNGNSMPSGSAVAYEVITPFTTGCAVSGGGITLIPNRLTSVSTIVGFKNCAAGDKIIVKVTTPLGSQTSTSFNVPAAL